MSVEILDNGQWHAMPNATANNVESNRYLVTITQVPFWVRLTALDGAPLRVGGRPAFRVWGTRRSGDQLVLDVLVQ